MDTSVSSEVVVCKAAVMTEDMVREVVDESLDLPESVLAAQREAEDFADKADLVAGQTQNIEDAPLHVVRLTHFREGPEFHRPYLLS